MVAALVKQMQDITDILDMPRDVCGCHVSAVAVSAVLAGVYGWNSYWLQYMPCNICDQSTRS